MYMPAEGEIMMQLADQIEKEEGLSTIAPKDLIKALRHGAIKMRNLTGRVDDARSSAGSWKEDADLYRRGAIQAANEINQAKQALDRAMKALHL